MSIAVAASAHPHASHSKGGTSSSQQPASPSPAFISASHNGHAPSSSSETPHKHKTQQEPSTSVRETRRAATSPAPSHRALSSSATPNTPQRAPPSSRGGGGGGGTKGGGSSTRPSSSRGPSPSHRSHSPIRGGPSPSPSKSASTLKSARTPRPNTVYRPSPFTARGRNYVDLPAVYSGNFISPPEEFTTLAEVCGVCGLPSTVVCTSCGLASYCGEAHRSEAWGRLGHEHTCGMALPTPLSLQDAKVDEAVAALVQHGAAHTGLAESAIARITHHCRQGAASDRNINKVVNAGGVNGIVRAMQTRLENNYRPEGVLASGCALLALIGNNPERQRIVAEAGGFNVVVDVLKGHLGSVRTQVSGAIALSSLGASEPGGSQAVGRGAIPHLTQAMITHVGHTDVQAQVCFALAALVSNPTSADVRCKQALEAGAFGAIGTRIVTLTLILTLTHTHTLILALTLSFTITLTLALTIALTLSECTAATRNQTAITGRRIARRGNRHTTADPKFGREVAPSGL